MADNNNNNSPGDEGDEMKDMSSTTNNNNNNNNSETNQQNPAGVAGAAGAPPIMPPRYPPAPENIPSRPESPAEEKNIIKALHDESEQAGMQLGETYFLIHARWWAKWKNFVNFDSDSTSYDAYSRPGPIDNDEIIEPGNEEDPRLRRTAMENYDFNILSLKVWYYLQAWYGGGPIVARKVINTGYSMVNLTVETRPLALKVFKSSALSENQGVNVLFSKVDTIGYLKKVMCARFGLNEDDVRVWDFHAMNRYKLLEDMTAKLESSQIIDGQPMLLEEKDANGQFPEAPKSKMSSYGSYGWGSSGGPCDPGTSGLSNLGNTCFMNSALQCLSNTQPLSDYFVKQKHKLEVNTDNPLGTGGKLANAYGELMKELWSGENSTVAPREFKHKLEGFAPQFAGYQQHDSQELLAYLLDGLHEDLNRIKKKPYIENPEVEDQANEQKVADEAWTLHRKRNNSIIVDWFQGQLKSTLVCPKCNRISITFDPFMYLSLPLPMKNTRSINIYIWFMDENKLPGKFQVDVAKFASISDLKKALLPLTKIQPENLFLFDVYNGKFFKQLNDKDSVDVISERDIIWGQEVLSDDDVHYYPIVFRKEGMSPPSFYYPNGYPRTSTFLVPLVLSVKNYATLTYWELYEKVWKQFAKLFNKNFLEKDKNEIGFEIGKAKEKVIRYYGDMMEGGENENKEKKEDNENNENNENEKKEKENNENNEDEKKENQEEEEKKTSDDDDLNEDDEEKRKKKVAEMRKKREKEMLEKQRKKFFCWILTGDANSSGEGLVLTGELNLQNKTFLTANFDESLADALFDDWEKNIQVDASCLKEEEKLDDQVSLQKCLEMFTTQEQLGPEDPWYCNKCKEHVQAFKKFDLWRMPPYLVIHLKRFSFKNKYSREKLETFVDYPGPEEFLDLGNFIKGPKDLTSKYELYAVSNHFGSLGGGHYIAHAKHKTNGKWYKFDDSHVAECNSSNAKTSSAYVLFYRRDDSKNISVDNIGSNNNNNNNNSNDNSNENKNENNSNNNNATSHSNSNGGVNSDKMEADD